MANVKVTLKEREIGGIDVVHSIAITDGNGNVVQNLEPTTNVKVEINCKDVEVTSPTYLQETVFIKYINSSGETDVIATEVSASSRYKLTIGEVTDLTVEEDKFTSCTSMQNSVCGCKIEGSCCGNCSFTCTYDADGNCTTKKSACTKGNGCCIKGTKIPELVLKNEATAALALLKALSDL